MGYPTWLQPLYSFPYSNRILFCGTKHKTERQSAFHICELGMCDFKQPQIENLQGKITASVMNIYILFLLILSYRYSIATIHIAFLSESHYAVQAGVQLTM